MSSSNEIKAEQAKYPVTDQVLDALGQTKRGCEELLVEAEWVAKLAKSQATGVPLRIKSIPSLPPAKAI